MDHNSAPPLFRPDALGPEEMSQEPTLIPMSEVEVKGNEFARTLVEDAEQHQRANPLSGVEHARANMYGGGTEVAQIALLRAAHTDLKASENIRQHKEQLQELSQEVKIARLDELTGLEKKQALLKAANAEIALNPDDQYAMFFIDLRNFKAINDNDPSQHARGDAVLMELAHSLKQTMRTHDIPADHIARGSREDDGKLARLGGDEFAVFSKLTSRDERPVNAADSVAAIRKRLDEVFTTYVDKNPDLKVFDFGATIGFAIRQPGETAEEMLDRSDKDMYKRKEEYRELHGSYR